MFREAINIWWNQWTWPLKLGTFAAIIVLLLIVFFSFKSCFKSEPKLDQKEIIEAQQAIEKNDRKVMVEILSNSDVREQGIDNSIILAEEATKKAKQNYSGKSNEEIAAELERRLAGE